MIYGIGADIVHILRISRILQKYEEKFLSKVYTKNEIEISKRYSSKEVRAKYFAKRFAAKEAFVKALGIGFNHGILMKDIEVFNDVKGKPRLTFRKNFVLKEEYKIHLTISDDRDYATAFVVICN